MGKLIVELRTDIQSKSIDIEMLDEEKLSNLMPILIKVINYPEKNDNGEIYHYWLSDIKGNPISLDCTPSEAGIGNKSVLLLNRGLHLPDMLSNDVQLGKSIEKADKEYLEFTSDASTSIQRNISPQDVRGELNIPASWKKIVVKKD